MKLSRLICGIVLGGSLIVGPAGGAFANDEDLSAIVKGLQKQIAAQNQRIQQLETMVAKSPGVSVSQLEQDVALLKRQRGVDQEVQMDLLKQNLEAPVVTASKEGFSLKSQDGNFLLKLRGLVQTDGRFFGNEGTPPAVNTFLIRKARPILEGTLYKYFDFKIMGDFAPSISVSGTSGAPILVDAYADFTYWKAASLRAGKFKSPIGLERLQPDTVNAFPELSLVSNLVPNRDVGIDLHGDLFYDRVSYDLGVFNGAVDFATNDTDNKDDKDFVGRVFIKPFKYSTNVWLSGLGMGFAGSFGASHSPTLPSYKTFGQQTFFTYASTVSANGKRFRLAPQLYYYNGPFGLMSEFVQSTQDLYVSGARSGSSAFKNMAGQLTVSYVVTGENASYNGVIPKNDFNPGKGKWGAFELVGRTDFFNADKKNLTRFANLSSSARRATGWGLGFNWYLNKNLKFSTGFEETFLDAGGLTKYGTQTRPIENAFISRVQVAF
ncbi:MAG: porin [Candidatus Omnitrophota bacterium]